MDGINGVQWARVWANAWRDPKFKETLENDPRTAAEQFKVLCSTTPGHDPFPTPNITHKLLDLDEMDEYLPGINFQDQSISQLDDIVQREQTVTWVKSKWSCPDQLIQKLKDGALEIH